MACHVVAHRMMRLRRCIADQHDTVIPLLPCSSGSRAAVYLCTIVASVCGLVLFKHLIEVMANKTQSVHTIEWETEIMCGAEAIRLNHALRLQWRSCCVRWGWCWLSKLKRTIPVWLFVERAYQRSQVGQCAECALRREHGHCTLVYTCW